MTSDDVGPTKLYRRTDDGLEYWETWLNDDDDAIIHTGRVGERGETTTMHSDEFAPYIVRKVPELYGAGFRPVPEEEHAVVLVQWPRNLLPEETSEMEALWDEVEHWVNEELGWTGLGRCTGVDLSTELVAIAETVDQDLAVKVLAASLVRSDLPAGGVVVVRIDDERDEIRWPPERAGEDVSDELPPG